MKNPFDILGIQLTNSTDIINSANAQQIKQGGTEQKLWELKVAHQNCLVYAQYLEEPDEHTLFSEEQLNSSEIIPPSEIVDEKSDDENLSLN